MHLSRYRRDNLWALSTEIFPALNLMARPNFNLKIRVRSGNLGTK